MKRESRPGVWVYRLVVHLVDVEIEPFHLVIQPVVGVEVEIRPDDGKRNKLRPICYSGVGLGRENRDDGSAGKHVPAEETELDKDVPAHQDEGGGGGADDLLAHQIGGRVDAADALVGRNQFLETILHSGEEKIAIKKPVGRTVAEEEQGEMENQAVGQEREEGSWVVVGGGGHAHGGGWEIDSGRATLGGNTFCTLQERLASVVLSR